MTPPLQPLDTQFDKRVAWALHQLAYDESGAFLVTPGYARQDTALRRHQPNDESWFYKRLDMGEQTAMQTIATKRLTDFTQLNWPLPKEVSPTTFQVSPALRLVWLDPDHDRIAIGGRVPAELITVALHGRQFRDVVAAIPSLTGCERQLLTLHLGATQLLRVAGEQIDVDRLMKTAGKALLPLRGEEERGRAWLHHLAKTCLDQPYGEVARIASGFHGGRTDRLHRAWQRGFFVPRGVDLIAPLP